MSQNYVTFKKFPDAIQARELQQYFIKNGIECTFASSSSGLDSSFTSDHLKEYEIQLKQENFDAAHTLLEKHAEEMMAGLGDDYYLLSFTNEELMDVVTKQDEWSEFDYVLARRLLEERGQAIDENHLKALRIKRIQELAKPERSHKVWIIAGYILALAGGFFGIIIGYVIWTSRKTLPNGQVVPSYVNGDRIQGKTIFIIGVIVLPLIIMSKILAKAME